MWRNEVRFFTSATSASQPVLRPGSFSSRFQEECKKEKKSSLAPKVGDNVFADSRPCLRQPVCDLLQLRLLPRGDVDVGSVLNEGCSHHFAQSAPSTSDEGVATADGEEGREGLRV